MGDAIYLHVIFGLISAEGNHVKNMQIPAVGVEEGDDVKCRGLCIEGIGILEVIVPHLVDDITEELGNARLCCLETSVVIEGKIYGQPPHKCG